VNSRSRRLPYILQLRMDMQKRPRQRQITSPLLPPGVEIIVPPTEAAPLSIIFSSFMYPRPASSVLVRIPDRLKCVGVEAMDLQMVVKQVLCSSQTAFFRAHKSQFLLNSHALG
jgi:hypothetical protein